MVEKVKISPPNSVILIMDYASGQIPESFGGRLVAATSSCIAVGTLSEFDGVSTIVLANKADYEVAEGEFLVFEDVIEVHSRNISVCTVSNEVLLSMDVSSQRCNVQIWVNDKSEPDKICILVNV
jgi:hypothetical protein